MEKVLGIIAEYDPFHKGHLHHLREAKSLSGADTVVSVMSGDFVQRGEPAIFNKWNRAEAAVLNGVDLVLELPFVYACNNAEYFAKGAVKILDGIRCVDYISFGSESDNVSDMQYIADVLINREEELVELIKEEMAKGVSFPKSRYIALVSLIGEKKAAIIKGPNDILGVEYIKQLILNNSKIEPITVKRFGASPDEINQDEMLAGATAIRRLYKEGEDICKYLPEATNKIMFGSGEIKTVFLDDFFQIITYVTRSMDKSKLGEIFTATEGLENRLVAATLRATNIEEIIRKTKTKRYTETRIKRLIMHTVMGLTKNEMQVIESGGIFARILAANESGRKLIKRIKKNDECTVPLISNLNKQRTEIDFEGMREIDKFNRRSSEIYHLVSEGDLSTFSDYSKYPIKL